MIRLRVYLNYGRGIDRPRYHHLFPPGYRASRGEVRSLCGDLNRGGLSGRIDLAYYFVEKRSSVSKFFGSSLCEECREKIKQ